MRLVLTVNDSDIERIASLYSASNDVVAKAINRSINRAISYGNKILRQDISARSNVPQPTIRRRLSSRSSKRNTLFGVLWLGANDIRASNLFGRKLRPEDRNRFIGKTIRVRGREFPGSFMATMKSGRTDIFRRRGKEKLPIDIVMVRINEDWGNITEQDANRIYDAFMKNFEHEIYYYTKVRAA